MKSAGKARNNGLYRHIRTSKEIIRNLLNDYPKKMGANEASRPTSSKKSTVTAHLLKSNPLLLSGGKKPASRKIS